MKFPSPFGPSLPRPMFGPSIGYKPRLSVSNKTRKLPKKAPSPLGREAPVKDLTKEDVAILEREPVPLKVVVPVEHPLAVAARAGRRSVLWHYASRTPIAIPSDPSERRAFLIARWRRQEALGRITPAELVTHLKGLQ